MTQTSYKGIQSISRKSVIPGLAVTLKLKMSAAQKLISGGDEEEEGCADWRNRVGSAEVAEAGGAPPLLLPVQFQMQQQREQAAAGCWNLPDRPTRAELDIWKRMSRNTFLC